jgi:hypothetical protein
VSDRMFHVLVLGGVALVGCGGSTSAGPDKSAGDAAPTDASTADEFFPAETANVAYDAGGSPGPEDAGTDRAEPLGDAHFPSELPPPPPELDAQAGGTGDAGEYADARLPDAGICVPCEALK